MRKVLLALRYHDLVSLTLDCGHIVYRKRRRPRPKAVCCEHCERKNLG